MWVERAGDVLTIWDQKPASALIRLDGGNLVRTESFSHRCEGASSGERCPTCSLAQQTSSESVNK